MSQPEKSQSSKVHLSNTTPRNAVFAAFTLTSLSFWNNTFSTGSSVSYAINSSSRKFPAPSSGKNSIHSAIDASLGIRQSARGDRQTEPTFTPSGRQFRLNCCVKTCGKMFSSSPEFPPLQLTEMLFLQEQKFSSARSHNAEYSTA